MGGTSFLLRLSLYLSVQTPFVGWSSDEILENDQRKLMDEVNNFVLKIDACIVKCFHQDVCVI